jgi:RNA polymerase sigma factor (sigma-70 family)
MEMVYRETFKPTWDLLGHLGILRREDREDVAQNIYVIISGKLDTYDPSMRLQAWVNGYAVNIARRYKQLARNHREQLLGDEAGEQMDEGPTPEQRAIDDERRTILDRLIAMLEEDRRLVLVMKELQNLDMLDVARALGIPIATGWTRLRLARADLEAAIRRLGARERDALGAFGMALAPMTASDLDRLFGDARQAPISVAPDSGTAARIWRRLQEQRPSVTINGSLPFASPAAPAARTLAGVFATGVGLGAAALFALLPLAEPARVTPAPSARAEVAIVAPAASATTASTTSADDARAVTSAAPPPSLSVAPSLPSAPSDAEEGDGRAATEGALIQRASAALAAGRPAEAIKLAQKHAAKFPRGKMGQERDVILIQALVLSGQREKATELAARFRRASPASPFLPTIDAAIGAKPSP